MQQTMQLQTLQTLMMRQTTSSDDDSEEDSDDDSEEDSDDDTDDEDEPTCIPRGNISLTCRLENRSNSLEFSLNGRGIHV